MLRSQKLLSRRRRRQSKAQCVSAGLVLAKKIIKPAQAGDRALIIKGLSLVFDSSNYFLSTLFPALTHSRFTLSPACAGWNLAFA